MKTDGFQINISLTYSVRTLGTEREPQTKFKAKVRKILGIVMLGNVFID